MTATPNENAWFESLMDPTDRRPTEPTRRASDDAAPRDAGHASTRSPATGAAARPPSAPDDLGAAAEALDLSVDEIAPTRNLKEGFTGQER